MFRSAHSALAWAYETIDRPIVKMSSANRMQEQPTRRSPPEAIQGLSVHEQHAQAAAIIRMANGYQTSVQGIHCSPFWRNDEAGRCYSTDEQHFCGTRDGNSRAPRRLQTTVVLLRGEYRIQGDSVRFKVQRCGSD